MSVQVVARACVCSSLIEGDASSAVSGLSRSSFIYRVISITKA